MTCYRKLNPQRGPIPYRDTWHAHPAAHRRGRRRLVTALRAVGEAAAFLAVLWAILFGLWLASPAVAP